MHTQNQYMMAKMLVSHVLYSPIFCEKMIKIWDLPGSEDNVRKFFQSY